MPVNPTTRAAARAFAREHRGDPRAIVARARALFAKGDRLGAFEVCRAAPDAVARMSRAQVTAFTKGMAEWWSVDCFACFIGGVAWREGRLSDADIARLTASSDRWRRRAALACTIPLNSRARGSKSPRGDARRTLAVCCRLIDDHDDMVVKAMSWALRELARLDRAPVERFLRTHAGRLAPRVNREVRNKLSTGLKNPRRRRVS